jgi:cytochrome c oxidase subunit 2
MRNVGKLGRAVAISLASALPAVAFFLLSSDDVALADGLFPPDGVTEQAKKVNDLYVIVFILAAIVFVAVEGAIILFAFRYRKKGEKLPEQIHGNTAVEMVWTLIPAVIVAVLFTLSWRTLSDIEGSSQDALTVEVQAFQWQWQFTYPEEDITIFGTPEQPPELVVPVGQPVRLRLQSNDVIHSFYVPQFLRKLDVIPGRINEFEFAVTEEGTYPGQCAEFCGLGHAQMTFSVRALPPDEFAAWVVSQKAQGAVPGADQMEIALLPAKASVAQSGVTVRLDRRMELG